MLSLKPTNDELLTPADLYCERLGAEFWAEPLNALSNIIFIFASLWAWRTATKLGRLDGTIISLCILSAGIGIGSFLFHTYANLWSSFADVIPIWSFVALYVVISVIKITGKSPLRVGGIALGIMAIIIGIVWIISSGSATQVEASTDPLNGSAQYAPALIALWFFAFITYRRNYSIKPWIISAALVFTLSLVARTLDLHLCNTFPIGTHFMWHILNGIMVALLLQGILRENRH